MTDCLLFYYSSSLKLWRFHPSKQESLEILTTSTCCSQWTNLVYYLLLFYFWNSTFVCPVGIFSNSRRERMNAGSIRKVQMYRSTLTCIQAHPVLDWFGYSNALVYSSNLLVHMFNRYRCIFWSGFIWFWITACLTLSHRNLWFQPMGGGRTHIWNWIIYV